MIFDGVFVEGCTAVTTLNNFATNLLKKLTGGREGGNQSDEEVIYNDDMSEVDQLVKFIPTLKDHLSVESVLGRVKKANSTFGKNIAIFG